MTPRTGLLCIFVGGVLRVIAALGVLTRQDISEPPAAEWIGLGDATNGGWGHSTEI